MEPTKQGVPADASSSQQQQQPQPQQYPPQSALPPDRRAVQRPQPQQQYPPPFAPPQQQHYPRPFALPPQQHDVQRPQLPNLQRSPYLSMPQAHGRAYIPHVGAAIPGGINASHYGADTLRFNGPAVPHSSVARSELNVSAEEYRSVSALGDNASLDRYISDHLNAGDAGSSAFVVCLLNEGREDVRRSVFRAVMGALHFVMRSRNWCVVFLELLRAPRFYELQAIVVACTMGQVRLLDVVKSENGATSLRNLLEAVIPYPQLRWQLINRLLDEGLFHHWKGPHLLRSIFTTSTFPYTDSSIAIRRALNNFMGVLSSTFGSKSMVKCFKAARNPVLQAELQALETIILSHIVQIANGKYSNFFLQKVLKHGCERLRVNITGLVIEYVVILSLDEHGSHVVQACFRGMAAGDLPLLVRLRLGPALEKFRLMSDELLGELVQHCHANYVIQELLLAGRIVSPEETVALARRINTLRMARLELIHPAVRRVMGVVRMVLSVP